MGRMVYVKSNKRTTHDSGHWNERKRIEAVTTYLSTGNRLETSRLTGVPVKTLDTWKYKDWWKEMEKTIRSEEEQQLDAKLTKIIDKTLEKLVDSIENGEHIYDQRTGKIKRMPAKMRDLNNAFNTILDKRQLIRKQPTKIIEQTSTATQLQQLADSFAKFVQKKVDELPEVEYIEGETVIQQEDGTYAIHDQWKEGLQEGTELGTHEKEESCEGPGTT